MVARQHCTTKRQLSRENQTGNAYMERRITSELQVALFTHQRTAELGAGDWVQARKTHEGLLSIGASVEHIIYHLDDEVPLNGAVSLQEVPDRFDVWHFVPGHPAPSHLARLHARRKVPHLVCSPVYWDSATHRAVIARNTNVGFRRTVLAYYVKMCALGALGHTRRALPYDLYLPNSQAEIKVLLRDYRINKDALLGAVPNAADPAPDTIEVALSRSREYLLYPALFAPRKNQLGFIRALRNSAYKVVFMGGPLPTSECERYFAECKDEAPSTWEFLGRVAHRSAAFYDVMRRARVACLASSCETPGIALIEAATLGVRPAITREGSAAEYFGFEAEYFEPLDFREIACAVSRAWNRGHLSAAAVLNIRQFTWATTATATLRMYEAVVANRPKSDRTDVMCGPRVF